MIRHIEFIINYDLTCYADSLEDFCFDDKYSIEDAVYNYFNNSPTELLDNIKIKKVWYEMEEINESK